MKPARFEMSADARFLRQLLEKLQPGEMISYSALSTAISKKVEGGTSALQTAKRSLLREGYVFAPVTGQGLRRLNDEQVVDSATHELDGIRRRARRVGQKLSTVSVDKLSPQKQLAYTAKASIAAAVQAFTGPKAVEKIEKVASGRASELPIAETLRALGYVFEK